MIGGASAGAGRHAEGGAELPAAEKPEQDDERGSRPTAEVKNSFGCGKNDTNTAADSLWRQRRRCVSSGINSHFAGERKWPRPAFGFAAERSNHGDFGAPPADQAISADGKQRPAPRRATAGGSCRCLRGRSRQRSGRRSGRAPKDGGHQREARGAGRAAPAARPSLQAERGDGDEGAAKQDAAGKRTRMLPPMATLAVTPTASTSRPMA